MRKFFLHTLAASAICLAANYNSVAQSCSNLVTNGSFERAKVKPTSGQISNVKVPSNFYVLDELYGWESPDSDSSPDFYSTATSYPQASTNPDYAFEGPFSPLTNVTGRINGCVGLFTYGEDPAVPGPTVNLSEFVAQVLPTELEANSTYYASMRVYLASSSTAAARIGLDVSSTSHMGNINPPTIPQYAVGQSSIQSAVPVTAHTWTQVSGTFPGTANAKYLLIGNFDKNTHQPVTPTTPPDPDEPGPYSYVYVDSVEIYKIPTAGQNTTLFLCQDQVARVTLGEGCSIPGATYRWRKQSGAGTFIVGNTLRLTASVAQTTLYYLSVYLPNGTINTSSVTVTVNNPTGPQSITTTLDLLGAQKLCPGNTVRIDASTQNIVPPYYWTVTTYVNGNPRTPITSTSSQSYMYVSVGQEEVDVEVTAIECATGQFLPPAGHTLIPWRDPYGGVYCDPSTPFRAAFNPTLKIEDTYVEVRDATPKPASSSRLKQPAATSSAQGMNATLFDSQGHNVGSATAVNETLRIPTTNLPSGLYYMVMHNGNQVIKHSVLLQR